MPYRVSLYGGGGEAHARVPQALVARVGEHLRAAGLLDVVDLLDAALLALRCRGDRVQVLLVGKDVGDVRGGLLQRASGSSGFGRIFVCGLGRGRVEGALGQIAEGAARGCLGQALLGRDVGPVRRRGAHVDVAGCDLTCGRRVAGRTGRIGSGAGGGSGADGGKMGKNASVSVSATVYKTGRRQAVDVVVVQVALQVGEVASPRDWWGSQGSPAISPPSVHSSRPIFTPSQAFLASPDPKDA
jgi:hypothetical protein